MMPLPFAANSSGDVGVGGFNRKRGFDGGSPLHPAPHLIGCLAEKWLQCAVCSHQCCVLYSNIRGLYENLHDLIVASKGFDILFCSETLVSNFRHISELVIPGFKRPILFKRNEINRAQGMAVYIRSGCSASHKATFECGCHEVQIIKVCGKHNNFYLFSVYQES